MNETLLIAIAAIAVLAALILLFRRKPAAPPVAAPKAEEGDGIVDSAAAAAQDVVGQFIGIDVHPDGPADELTRLKGLGPKAAMQLNALGITRYAQLAALDDAGVAALDAQMGAFRGRILRDRWVDQARYLAAGDTAGFEAEFGKLGGVM
jgi:predicted flap endonuclease-1-like 5' DNA nuclease